MTGPGSLLDCFEPPKGYHGDFGWVCGFSGDAGFLDLACERFTGLSGGQRTKIGRVWLGLMLDPTCRQVAPSASPGALHLLALHVLPYRLLHAKVALLNFRGESDPAAWCLRLVVSTGNWTRMTLESSLDVAWRADLPSTRLKSPDGSQIAADLRAAAAMLAEVRGHMATEVLSDPTGTVADETREAMARLDSALASLPARGGPKPRFFDSRTASLLDQLPAQVGQVAGLARRNTVVLGSGFFEAAVREGERPAVVQTILDRLSSPKQGAALLTTSAAVTLVVNPTACQQVALAGPSLGGWRVKAAHDPDGGRGAPRSLHAKFIFSANARSGSDRCASGWVYIGSGNLTDAGFCHRATARKGTGPGRGNLEAGVVVATGDLTWSGLAGALPVDLESKDLTLDAGELEPGDAAPEREANAFAPPFGFVRWIEEEGRGWLCPPEQEDASSAQIESLDGVLLSADEAGRFPWPGAAPVEVVVQWRTEGTSLRARIPVLDEYGRIAGRPLAPLDFSGILEELGRFPAVRDEDEDGDDAPPEDTDGAATDGRGLVPADRTPIRTTMQLLEQIAGRQTALDESAWKTWCGRLEQALLRAKDCPTVSALRGFGINPITALYRPEFRPSFAETPDGDSSSLYEEVLRRVEDGWQVRDLVPLVAAQDTK